MRAFLAGFALAIMSLCLVVGSINYVVNPSGYFSVRAYPALLSNTRTVKLELMRKAKPPQLLILGSSTSMKRSRVRCHSISSLTSCSVMPRSFRALR